MNLALHRFAFAILCSVIVVADFIHAINDNDDDINKPRNPSVLPGNLAQPKLILESTTNKKKKRKYDI